MNRPKMTAGWMQRAAAALLGAAMIAGLFPGRAAMGAEVYQIDGPGAEFQQIEQTTDQEEQELNGVWISYLEWEKLPVEEEAFDAAVDEMLDNCVSWGMNAVFVHVHSHTDAMYPSDILPWSKYVTGTQGTDPGYDPFGYFVEAAHARGLQIHAWFNPYRVTGAQVGLDTLSDDHPVRQWLSDDTTENDRWVLYQNGQYYLNPSVPEVQQLVVDCVKEVAEKYDVDGIHFDDYFYPTVDDSDSSAWFDKPEYDASGSSLSIADWRRENVSQLVAQVYAAVKSIDPDLVFGISPQGYLANLRSDTSLFVDIDRWMSQDGYVDYIMPQLYWGFEAKTKQKELAAYAFENNLASWIELKSQGNVTLYLGLGMYRAGTNVADNNDVSEWLRYDDIIRRQVETGRASGQVSGYCYYCYSSFLESTAQAEVSNLVALLTGTE